MVGVFYWFIQRIKDKQFSIKLQYSNIKILIIEDEYSLADAIAETLKKENFTTNIITDGEEGENEALTNVYDLILLDIMLPNKDGLKY